MDTWRTMPWIVIVFGLAVGPLGAPWILGDYPGEAMLNSLAVGVLMIAFALVRGKIEKSYGGGWRGYGTADPDDAPNR